MSVLFSMPFSNEFLHFHFRHRYANLLFSMASISPYTYSEFHLPVSPSQNASVPLVCVDNQPALSSSVHCLFSRCLVIVQHGKPQCIFYVWTLKAPLLSDPRASFLCLFGFTPCSQIPPNQPLRVDKCRGIFFLLLASREGFKMTISISSPYLFLGISVQ